MILKDEMIAMYGLNCGPRDISNPSDPEVTRHAQAERE